MLSALSEPSTSLSVPVPFVGRQSELEWLRAARERTLRDAGCMALLAGEAGAGKTRLAEEFGRWTARQGDWFLKGRAVGLQGADPYGPLVSVLEGLLGIEAGMSVHQRVERLEVFLRDVDIDPGIFTSFLKELIRRSAPDAPRSAEEPEIRRHILFEGMSRMLQAAAERQPVCVLLDDLQWADGVVFEVLDFLAERLDRARVLLLLTYRKEEISRGRDSHSHPLYTREKLWVNERGAHRLLVERLTAAEVEELAVRLSGGALAPERIGELYRQTEGLPLFVVECLKAYVQEEYHPGWKLPPEAERIIAYRLDGLAPEDRAALRCASLLGETFDGELLAEVLGEPRARVFGRLELVREVHQLLEREGESIYRFAHARIREALQEELPAHLRRVYCLTAGEVLEREEGETRVFDLVFLFREGGDLERAAWYGARAARQALETQAETEAARHAREAVALLERIAQPGDDLEEEVCTAAGRVLQRKGNDRRQALALFERALEVCGDPLRRADLHLMIADLLGYGLQGRGPAHDHVAAACREIGPRVDTVQMARVYARQARHDDVRSQLAGILQALDLFERMAPDDPEIFSLYHPILHGLAVLDEREQLEAYVKRFRRWIESRNDAALTLSMSSTLAHVYESLGLCRRQIEEWERELVLERAIRRISRQRGLHQQLARLRAWLGEEEEAEEHWQQAVALGTGPGDLAFSRVVELAYCFSRTGRHELALELLEWAQEAGPITDCFQQRDALGAYFPFLGRVEWIFARAGRKEEFADYCRRLQEKEKAAGGLIRGCWWPEKAAVEDREWEALGVDFGTRRSGCWVWEDPHGVCAWEREGDGLRVRVAGILGFNMLTFPRLLHPLSGDFAVELQVAPAEEVAAAQQARREQARTDALDRSAPMPGAGGLMVRGENGDAVRLAAHVEAPGDVLFDGRLADGSHPYGRALIESGPIALRLQRQGERFKAHVRRAGGEWRKCGEVDASLGWRVWVGPCAEIPVEFYHFALQGETRFGAIRFFKPRKDITQSEQQEVEMLAELKEALAENGKGQAEFEQCLLRALVRGCGARWGRFMGVDEQGHWVERCQWTAEGGGLPGEDALEPPARPGERVAVLDGEGRVVCLPLTGDGARLNAWVLGRDERFSEYELELLDQAGPVAGALLEKHRLHEQARQRQVAPAPSAAEPAGFPRIVGHSAAMKQVFRSIERIAPGSAPALIQGESGTGKELVARAIHEHGPRQGRPFVAQNCAALAESLLESELFGYKKGAFTGASTDKPGLFEAADGGTIFLDEIADASPGVQAKLLRAVEEGEIRRVGDTQSRKVDVRIISASSRDLSAQVEAGKLREDLYYRLNVVRVQLPALRERREDIPLLADHFLRDICGRDGKKVRGFTEGALDLLGAHPWPGNVRELVNEVERCVTRVGAGGVIDVEELSASIRNLGGAARQRVGSQGSLRQMVEHLERAAIQETLARCEGNISQAARELGMSRPGLRKKVERYGLGS